MKSARDTWHMQSMWMSLIAMATNRLECGNWDFEDKVYIPV